jgi:hypothetical protein
LSFSWFSVYPGFSSDRLTFLAPLGSKELHASRELSIARLRISDQMLGGIETPRLNVTRGPHAPPRKRGGMIFRICDTTSMAAVSVIRFEPLAAFVTIPVCLNPVVSTVCWRNFACTSIRY